MAKKKDTVTIDSAALGDFDGDEIPQAEASLFSQDDAGTHYYEGGPTPTTSAEDNARIEEMIQPFVEQFVQAVQQAEPFGLPNIWKLISYNETEGVHRTTLAAQIDRAGIVLQTEVRQQNPDGSWALSQSSVTIPGVHIVEETIDQHIHYRIVSSF